MPIMIKGTAVCDKCKASTEIELEFNVDKMQVIDRPDLKGFFRYAVAEYFGWSGKSSFVEVLCPSCIVHKR